MGGLVLLASGCSTTTTLDIHSAVPATSISTDPPPTREQVAFNGSEAPGTIVVNTTERALYLVETEGRATRYRVAVGEDGLTVKGAATIGRKAEWPSWTPTESMIKRKPHLAQYAGGVPGGPANPLGARALYLFRDGKDTRFRLHGTNEPWSIGQAVSNGCIRLLNDDIIDLYERAPVGSPVVIA